MIACIIIVSLALAWLTWETECFNFYPRNHSSPPVKRLQSNSSGIKSKSNATGLTKSKLGKCQFNMTDIPCDKPATHVNKYGVKLCEYHTLGVKAFTYESRNTDKFTPIEKPIDKTIPYWWQPIKDNLLLCQGCRLHCHKDKERWTGWKLPTRTIKAWGSTIHFEEGCNIKRATMLKDIATLQKRHGAPHLKFGEPVGTKRFDIPQPQTYYAGQFEPTIDILVDGELKANINGDYKQGMIADIIKPYTKTVRAGKKTLTLLKGGYVENMGGGAYIAINGEVKNGEYKYFKS